MTPISDRKRREIAEREETFLDLALRIVLEQGYVGLTMDKLAEATEFSKGTLYLHFKNKEDVICALLRRLQMVRLDLFQRASQLELPPRQRITALGLAAELFVRLYPENARIEPILKASSIREKASQERCDALDEVELQCFAAVLEIAQDGQARGDLTFSDRGSPEHMVTGLWSMHVGVNLISSVGCGPSQAGGEAFLQDTLYENGARLLDGYGWRPLSNEFDYRALREELLRTQFATEAKQLKLADSSTAPN
ncbi:MAG: TetR/AcrR family transcriptional regulator [Planctomycetota bacterium]|nr:TetR/AcrR family transcriptional regulator [Planctomycetota bacterium]